MGIYTLEREQIIPASLNEVWDFISSPKNLKEITPDYLGFEILTDLPERMYEGLFITYYVKPLLGLKMKWVTEITHIKDKTYFVDEQRVGPYKIWHHQHHIKETPDGIWMKDIVDYSPPMGPLGAVANAWIIKSKLKEIFDYRFSKVEEIFGKPAQKAA